MKRVGAWVESKEPIVPIVSKTERHQKVPGHNSAPKLQRETAVRTRTMRLRSSLLLIVLFLVLQGTALGWYDETHLAIAKAAGYAKWYNAAGADITKTKAGPIETKNHYFNNTANLEITPTLVLEQANRYNDPGDEEGHLYGAIIASLRAYKKRLELGKYAEYDLAFCVHYVGDLSQPLHHIPNDDYNKTHHERNDGIVEAEVFGNINLIEKNMYPITLRTDHFEEDLAKEIVRVAGIARTLGLTLRRESRDITKGEAHIQLGHSASLVKAILNYLGK